MSTREGENQNRQSWLIIDNVIYLPNSSVHPKIKDIELSSSGHARLANQYRDSFLQSGDSKNFGLALHHYEVALDRFEKEGLMQAWIICNRLNLYLHQYESGALPLEFIKEEIEHAYEITAQSLTLRDAEFRRKTLEWIEATRHRLLYGRHTEETGEFEMPDLKLVGSRAIEGTFGPGSEPSPGAA